MSLVKCRDCGMLTVYCPGENEFIEINSLYRKEGSKNGIHAQNQGSPTVCFLSAHDIHAEMVELVQTASSANQSQRALQIIGKERECESFCKWRQGFSPKEHVEMLREDEKNLSDREWQMRMEDERKKFDREIIKTQSEIIDNAKAWYGKIIEKIERWKFIYSALGGIVGAAIVVALNKWFGINKDGTTQPK